MSKKNDLKKIIFYIDSMQKGGGANRVMANLTENFANDDYETILITDVGPKSNVLEYEINSKVKRYCLDEIIAEECQSNYKRIKTIRNIIGCEKPDAVVSFMGPPNIRMLLASVCLKTKKIISVRNDPVFEYGTGINKFLKCRILSLADGYVFQTNDVAKYFSKKIQKKSRVIFNPVRDEFFEIKRKDSVKNIIAVGRLDTQKNHELLIRAFKGVSDKFPDENLIIYGEGPLRNKLEKLICELDLTYRVLLPGNADNIADKLSEAKIFVLPSDFEGMPNALMEAMAVGVPVIATDCPCGGPRTLITNVKEGKLVAYRDADAMALAMDKLLTENKLRNEMNACEKARANSFKAEVVYKEWKGFVQGVL